MLANRQHLGLLSFAIVFVVISGAFLSLPGPHQSSHDTSSSIIPSQDPTSPSIAFAHHHHSSTTSSSTSSTSSSSSSAVTTSSSTTNPQAGSRNSLVWVFTNYDSNLQSIYNNAGSFTIASPTLYSINSASGQFQGNSSFDDSIESSIIDHGLQVWPLISSSSNTNIANMTSCLE